MNATYPVDRKRLFKSLTLFISMATIAPFTLLLIALIIQYVSSGFDYSKTAMDRSLPTLLLILACMPLLAATTAFLIALLFRLATITISEGAIYGRSFWGRRNRIPLTDITKLTPFSNNGISAIVVSSNRHGQIYISDKTERLSELLTILTKHLPEEDGPSRGSSPPTFPSVAS